MSENVFRLGSADIDSSRREAFMLAVAQSFEIYVNAYGEEPDAVAFVIGGALQPTHSGWEIHGESQRGGTTFLSLAAIHLNAEAAGRNVLIND